MIPADDIYICLENPTNDQRFSSTHALPAYSGLVDFAVDWLGEDRIVWGGHLESRSYANEISKVVDADLTDEQQFKIFGANLRRYAGRILRRKGYTFRP